MKLMQKKTSEPCIKTLLYKILLQNTSKSIKTILKRVESKASRYTKEIKKIKT